MDFQNAVNAVVRHQRKSDDLAGVFASVGVDGFIVRQLDDASSFGADRLSRRTEFFRQIVPANRLLRKAGGRFSRHGAHVDRAVFFLFADPDQRTAEHFDDFFAQESAKPFRRLSAQNAAQSRVQNGIHAFRHLAFGYVAQQADAPAAVARGRDDFDGKFRIVLAQSDDLRRVVRRVFPAQSRQSAERRGGMFAVGQNRLDAFADQFVVAVAEQAVNRRIRRDDLSVGIDFQNGTLVVFQKRDHGSVPFRLR